MYKHNKKKKVCGPFIDKASKDSSHSYKYIMMLIKYLLANGIKISNLYSIIF